MGTTDIFQTKVEDLMLIDNAYTAEQTRDYVASQLSVVASGTTAARKVNDRFVDIMNVKDFGAKGNGVEDDTDAINCAIAAAKTAKCKVMFPAGTYKVDGRLSLASSYGLHIIGLCGDGILKRTEKSLDYLFYINNLFATALDNHRNYVYASPGGGGDGLSPSSPMTFDQAILFVKTFGFLYGYWTIKLAAGTYRRKENIKDIYCEREYGLVIEGEKPSMPDTPEPSEDNPHPIPKENWTWPTKFIAYDSDTSIVLMFRNCSSIQLTYIECDAPSIAVNDKSYGIVVDYGCGRFYVFACCIRGGARGIYVNDAIYVSVSNSYIDGKSMNGNEDEYGGIGISYAVLRGNTNPSTDKRNTIVRWRLGIHCLLGSVIMVNNDILSCSSAAYCTEGFGFISKTTSSNCTERDCSAIRHEKFGRYGGMNIDHYTYPDNTAFGSIVSLTKDDPDGHSLYNIIDMLSSSVESRYDNKFNLGSGGHRWKEVFAATGAINTSDSRIKTQQAAIHDNVLDAWGDVEYKQFLFTDAVEEKGAAARTHMGLIAQSILQTFEMHGLDATKYGLLCYDSWPSEPAQYDDDGNIISPAREAGDIYSLRYSECFAVEAAYQRRKVAQLEQRIAALEEALHNN